MKTCPPDPGCERGYIHTYTVYNRALYLANLQLWIPSAPKSQSEYKVIRGIKPEPINSGRCVSLIYRNINVPLRFTGGILIGRGFSSTKVFTSRDYKYQSVYELIFRWGKLIRAINHSEHVRRRRERLIERNAMIEPKRRELRAEGLSWKEVEQKIQQNREFRTYGGDVNDPYRLNYYSPPLTEQMKTLFQIIITPSRYRF